MEEEEVGCVVHCVDVMPLFGCIPLADANGILPLVPAALIRGE